MIEYYYNDFFLIFMIYLKNRTQETAYIQISNNIIYYHTNIRYMLQSNQCLSVVMEPLSPLSHNAHHHKRYL